MEYVIEKKEVRIEIDDGNPKLSFELSDTNEISPELLQFMDSTCDPDEPRTLRFQCPLMNLIDHDIQDRKTPDTSGRLALPEKYRPRYACIREALLAVIDKIDDLDYRYEAI